MPFKRLVPIVLVVLALLAAVAWHLARVAPVPVAMAAAPPAAEPSSFRLGDAVVPPPVTSSRRALIAQYQLADHTLCSYAQASQYPPGSRPMAQNADQAYPNRPVLETHPMRLADGGVDSDVTLQTAQTRVYMAAGETVTFSIRAVDAHGAVVPLVVTRAVAGGIRYGAARTAAGVALDFVDDGAGSLAATLAPAQTGLAGFDGTIRTRVDYTVNGKQGAATFDVIYSPVLPAAWTGPVRETSAAGGLTFVLPVDVRVAGRYIVTGRVDDAQGRPFALLTFNDLLPTGPGEVPLTAFGKLLRDGAPVLPLTLRDVDGYLLRENTDPDRALMPRREGPVATGGAYPLDSFSEAPYNGEERMRYLAEFNRDFARARDALLRADPETVLPASACPPPVDAHPVR